MHFTYNPIQCHRPTDYLLWKGIIISLCLYLLIIHWLSSDRRRDSSRKNGNHLFVCLWACHCCHGYCLPLRPRFGNPHCSDGRHRDWGEKRHLDQRGWTPGNGPQGKKSLFTCCVYFRMGDHVCMPPPPKCVTFPGHPSVRPSRYPDNLKNIQQICLLIWREYVWACMDEVTTFWVERVKDHRVIKDF